MYTSEIVSWDDSTHTCMFRIEPPVKFISEGARLGFGKVVLRLLGRRVEKSIIDNSTVVVTHDNSEGTATLGFAELEILRYGSGEVLLKQALETALNGE